MSSFASRASKGMRSGGPFNQPQQRLAQVRRHLHSTAALNRKIRDAYILSAARTPTGKVLLVMVQLFGSTMLTDLSSMAHFLQSQLRNLAQLPSNPPSLNPMFPLL